MFASQGLLTLSVLARIGASKSRCLCVTCQNLQLSIFSTCSYDHHWPKCLFQELKLCKWKLFPMRVSIWGLVCAHNYAFHRMDLKDPDTHVLVRWMPATKNTPSKHHPRRWNVTTHTAVLKNGHRCKNFTKRWWSLEMYLETRKKKKKKKKSKVTVCNAYLFELVDAVSVGQDLRLKGLVFLQLLHLVNEIPYILEIIFIGHCQLVVDPAFSLHKHMTMQLFVCRFVCSLSLNHVSSTFLCSFIC